MVSDLVPMSSLSPNLILPEGLRPKLSQVSTLASIPIIDLNEDQHGHGNIVQKISQACEEYGFFQVINHGVPEELCTRMMNTITEFFNLPPEEKAQFFSTDPTKEVRIFNFYLKVKDQENVKMWSESFSQPWHPHDNFSDLLPKNPPQYREVFGEYAKEIGKLNNRLFSLISQGLGLEEDCIQKKLGDNPKLRAQGNYYPPCPEPELTLGLAVHTDPNALTVVLQSEGVTGLQVIKDGKWVSVDPVPNAFVVNLGDQIQVLSNGRYKSVHHRAVTNKEKLRVSLAMFYGPNKETWIGPIEELIDEEHPPVYRRYRQAEFLEEFMRQEGTRRMVKEAFEIRNQGKPVN
ncbi:protein DOWNY MILDEW RESISTANCE 6-like isoform X1 [Ziziphus jujuba]|uniref:Protein DOWNY MILDEW RESISTANCE 6-like isoform X1 n=1 Tax=Ziziphus jujuba TaxID=326968 RepID=A0ABM3I2L5_ZIZJJ|nr:protein DOWNY MILDEW RESISTANCE 6-like isoform X1 [Ziziphus jujuba]